MLRCFKIVVLWPAWGPWPALLARIHADLGANPIEFITHSTGDWTLIFLLITLAITPVRKLSGITGLFASGACWACLHFFTEGCI